MSKNFMNINSNLVTKIPQKIQFINHTDTSSKFIKLINRFRRYFFWIYGNQYNQFSFELQRCYSAVAVFNSLLPNNRYEDINLTKFSNIHHNTNFILKISMGKVPDHVFLMFKYKHSWYVLQSYFHSYSVWDTYGFYTFKENYGNDIASYFINSQKNPMPNIVKVIEELSGIDQKRHFRAEPLKNLPQIKVGYYHLNSRVLNHINTQINDNIRSLRAGSRLGKCYQFLIGPQKHRNIFRGSATFVQPINFAPAPLKSNLSNIRFTTTPRRFVQTGENRTNRTKRRKLR